MDKTRNFFFDKVHKAQFLNKMKIEEEVTLDGKTWYHIKYDNTAPKTAFLFTYLPYNMEHPWTYEGGREHTANDGSKFEMEHLHKMTMTEESPFYGMVFWWTG